LNCKMEYDENEMMSHLMGDEMFAANIATYLFELHKRIEELDKGTTALIIPSGTFLAITTHSSLMPSSTGNPANLMKIPIHQKCRGRKYN
jgi:hypothetical protein